MAVLRPRIVCCVLGLVMAVAGSACHADPSTQARKELDMADLCQLPEDEAALREYVLERVGGKITAEAVALLQAEFELVRDRTLPSMVDAMMKTLRDDGIILNMKRLEEYRDDPYKYHEEFEKEWRRAFLERFDGSTERAREYYDGPDPKGPSAYKLGLMKNSKSLRVRSVALRKRCTAADGVSYKLGLGATLDTTGQATFSEFSVEYRYEDIFAGRRPFSFERYERYRTNNKEWGALLTAKTAGFTLTQLDEYMDKLGCVRGAPHHEEYSAQYYYRIHPWLDLETRVSGYPNSKEINVKTSADGTVEQVAVLTGTQAATEPFGDDPNWLEEQ